MAKTNKDMSGKRKDFRIRISLVPQVGEILDHLLAQGIYGRSHSEVAERLLCRQLELMVGPPIRAERQTLNAEQGIKPLE